MEKESLNLKPTIKMLTLLTQFRLGSISDRFSNVETREISLNGHVYDFSAEYNSLDKSDILNIHNHLMRKNKIKKCSALPNRCLFRYYVLVNL